MNRQDTDDVKWWLGGIFFILIAVMILITISTVAISDNQRRQICLDHPTYKHCTDGSWF